MELTELDKWVLDYISKNSVSGVPTFHDTVKIDFIVKNVPKHLSKEIENLPASLNKLNICRLIAPYIDSRYLITEKGLIEAAKNPPKLPATVLLKQKGKHFFRRNLRRICNVPLEILKISTKYWQGLLVIGILILLFWLAINNKFDLLAVAIEKKFLAA